PAPSAERDGSRSVLRLGRRKRGGAGLTRRAAVPPRAVQAVAAIGVRRLAARIGAALRAATGVRKLAATSSMARAGLPTEVSHTVAATASTIVDMKAGGAASLTVDVGMGRSTMAPEDPSAIADTLIMADTASVARIAVRHTITPRGVDDTSVIGSTVAMLRDTTSVHAVTAVGATAMLIGAAVASVI